MVTGWCFGTFGLFFRFIYGMSSFPLTFIFFSGAETTNQIRYICFTDAMNSQALKPHRARLRAFPNTIIGFANCYHLPRWLLKMAKMAGWQPMEWSAGLAAVCQLTAAAARATDQHVHGPIEEQARLACHPHSVLHFVNRTSQAWLKRVLRQETSEAKALLLRWQQQTLSAVESLRSSCAGLLPFHFREAPFPQVDLQSLPYFLTTGEICCGNIRGDIMVFNGE